jgi:hypothetical protein
MNTVESKREKYIEMIVEDLVKNTIVTDGIVRMLPGMKLAISRNFYDLSLHDKWYREYINTFGLFENEKNIVFFKWLKKIRTEYERSFYK